MFNDYNNFHIWYFILQALKLYLDSMKMHNTSDYYKSFGYKFGKKYAKKPSFRIFANEVLKLEIKENAHDSVSCCNLRIFV